MSRPSLSFAPSLAVSAVDTLIAGDVLRVVLDCSPALKAKGQEQKSNRLNERLGSCHRLT